MDCEGVEHQVGVSEEIADVARFLASDAASFVVGETIAVAGVPDVTESPDVSGAFNPEPNKPRFRPEQLAGNYGPGVRPHARD